MQLPGWANGEKNLSLQDGRLSIDNTSGRAHDSWYVFYNRGSEVNIGNSFGLNLSVKSTGSEGNVVLVATPSGDPAKWWEYSRSVGLQIKNGRRLFVVFTDRNSSITQSLPIGTLPDNGQLFLSVVGEHIFALESQTGRLIGDAILQQNPFSGTVYLGLSAGPDSKVEVSRLQLVAPSKSIVLAVPTPTATPNLPPLVVFIQKADTYECNPSQCGAAKSGYILPGKRFYLGEVAGTWTYVRGVSDSGPRSDGAWVGTDSYWIPSASHCPTSLPRTQLRTESKWMGPVGVATDGGYNDMPPNDWLGVSLRKYIIGRIISSSGQEGQWDLTLDFGTRGARKVAGSSTSKIWLEDRSIPFGRPIGDYYSDVSFLPLECLFVAGDVVRVVLDNFTLFSPNDEVQKYLETNNTYKAVVLMGLR